jgi:myo-inositol-1(or 4)-monophosphatase
LPSPASKQPDSDVALLAAAARACGPLLREKFREPVKTWAKHGGSPVTEVDLALDAQLKSQLRDARPRYGWLSEETPDAPERLACTRAFIVDPLDGTQAFIKHKAEFCVSLAIADVGAVSAGVVYDPIADVLYEAALGQGAWMNGAPIRVTTTSTLSEASLLASKLVFANVQPAPRIDQKGALALRLALVAAGRFDGTLSLGYKAEWDLAAGALLVTEAGGRATGQTGSPLKFNQPQPRNLGIVAAGPALHGLLIDRAQSQPRTRAKADE